MLGSEGRRSESHLINNRYISILRGREMGSSLISHEGLLCQDRRRLLRDMRSLDRAKGHLIGICIDLSSHMLGDNAKKPLDGGRILDFISMMIFRSFFDLVETIELLKYD